MKHFNHHVFAISRRSSVAVFLIMAPSVTHAAVCSYEVVDEWNNGFKTEITISNQDEPTFSDWQLSWTLPEGSSINNSWNAVFDCNGNSCTATPPAWQPNIAAGASYKFGFVADKGNDSTDTSLVLQGDVCNAAPVIPDTPVTPATGFWTLNDTDSSFNYISMKKEHVAEINTFAAPESEQPAIQGSIAADGAVLLKINLNQVATGIDIRNTRLQSILFETLYLPDAWFRLQLEAHYLDSLQPGSTEIKTILGELSLHGIRLEVAADVMIARLSHSRLSVSNVKPVLIDSKNFDLDSGIEALRLVANLSSIGEAVPVYFSLMFDAQTDNNAAPLHMPTAPADPAELNAAFDTDDLAANLSWQDNSTNETQFLVRRQPSGGSWQTIAELSPNVNQLSEGLPDEGEYNYKVIALNSGVPSLATNVAVVQVTQGNPIVRGQTIFMEQCAGCHGDQGQGLGAFPAINTERNIETLVSTIVNTMPLNNPGACDEQCARDIAAFIETLWVAELTCDTSLTPISYGARQLKILTRREYQNSVEDLIGIDFDAASGLSSDNKIGFFLNNTHSSMVAASYSNFLLVAEEVAQWSADRDFTPALSCSSMDLNCAQQLINELAPKIFRRPLDDNERATWLAVANGSQTGGDIKQGIQLALEGLLSAPQFVYRHELGEPNPSNPSLDADAFELTSYEMATFLAYTFTGTTPDQTLLDAAANNELRDPQNITAHAARLAAGANPVTNTFVGSWLGTEDLALAAKDPQVWPGFADLVPHMQEELNRTFAHVMLQPDQNFAALYAGNFTFLNQTLAQHYGIDGVAGDDFQLMNTSDRGGILANGAFMARWGEAEETSPVLRSVRVRRRMLCQDQPDPPAGTFEAREAKLAELSAFLQDPTTTNRNKYHRLTEDSPCTNCHTQYINPLGFGMEDFDTVGRVRSADLRGNPVDATGQLFAPLRYSDIDQFLPFVGAKDLGSVLSGLTSAQECLPRQMFRFVIGVGHKEIDAANPDGPALAELEKAGYACEVEDLTDIMMNDSPRAMFEAFGSLESVRYRKAWSREAQQ